MEQLVFRKNGKMYEATCVSGDSTVLQIQYGQARASELNIYCRVDSSLEWYALKLITKPSKNFLFELPISAGIEVKIETNAPVDKAAVYIDLSNEDKSELIQDAVEKAEEAAQYAQSVKEALEAAIGGDDPAASTVAQVAKNTQQLGEIALKFTKQIAQIREWLNTIEQGCFAIADGDGNVALKLDSNGFDVAKLSKHLTDLIKQIDGIGLQLGETHDTAFSGDKGKKLAEDVDALKKQGGSKLQQSTVLEDGLFFIDSKLNIGACINASGIHAINIPELKYLD